VCNFFSIFIFLSTCFGPLCAHHQEKQLYLYDTWYLSFCVSGHYVPIIRRNNCIYATLGICHCVSGHYLPIIRRNNCIYATLGICHCVDDCLVCTLFSTCFGRLCAHHQELITVCDTWYLSLCADGSLLCTLHTIQSSTHSDKYQVFHRYSSFC
jgi:hypothetical protein